MAFNRFTKNVLNVSALPDRVQNQASMLKATFDQAGVDIKLALNALIAELEASTSYLLPNDMKKIKDSGMKPEEYILLKYISNLGGTKKDEKYNSLVSAGYTQKETEEFLTDYKGYKFDNTSTNALPTLKQQRAKFLLDFRIMLTVF